MRTASDWREGYFTSLRDKHFMSGWKKDIRQWQKNSESMCHIRLKIFMAVKCHRTVTVE